MIKCQVGNKPCGGRCVPKKFMCKNEKSYQDLNIQTNVSAKPVEFKSKSREIPLQKEEKAKSSGSKILKATIIGGISLAVVGGVAFVGLSALGSSAKKAQENLTDVSESKKDTPDYLFKPGNLVYIHINPKNETEGKAAKHYGVYLGEGKVASLIDVEFEEDSTTYSGQVVIRPRSPNDKEPKNMAMRIHDMKKF